MKPKNCKWYIGGAQKSENPFALRNYEKVYFFNKVMSWWWRWRCFWTLRVGAHKLELVYLRSPKKPKNTADFNLWKVEIFWRGLIFVLKGCFEIIRFFRMWEPKKAQNSGVVEFLFFLILGNGVASFIVS